MHFPCSGRSGLAAQTGYYTKSFAKSVVAALETQFDLDTRAMYAARAEHETMAVEGEGQMADSGVPAMTPGYDLDDSRTKRRRRRPLRLHRNFVFLQRCGRLSTSYT